MLIDKHDERFEITSRPYAKKNVSNQCQWREQWTNRWRCYRDQLGDHNRIPRRRIDLPSADYYYSISSDRIFHPMWRSMCCLLSHWTRHDRWVCLMSPDRQRRRPSRWTLPVPRRMERRARADWRYCNRLLSKLLWEWPRPDVSVSTRPRGQGGRQEEQWPREYQRLTKWAGDFDSNQHQQRIWIRWEPDYLSSGAVDWTHRMTNH